MANKSDYVAWVDAIEEGEITPWVRRARWKRIDSYRVIVRDRP